MVREPAIVIRLADALSARYHGLQTWHARRFNYFYVGRGVQLLLTVGGLRV